MKKCIQAMLSNDMPQEMRAEMLKETKRRLLEQLIDTDVFVFRQEKNFSKIALIIETDEASKREMESWLGESK